MFTTTQDYFKAVQSTLLSIPKTPDEVKAVLEKTKKVVETETENIKDVISVYNKAARGDASINEISKANKKAQDLFVSARFATVMAMPGAIFALPILNKVAEEYNIDFIPASVKKEFDI